MHFADPESGPNNEREKAFQIQWGLKTIFLLGKIFYEVKQNQSEKKDPELGTVVFSENSSSKMKAFHNSIAEFLDGVDLESDSDNPDELENYESSITLRVGADGSLEIVQRRNTFYEFADQEFTSPEEEPTSLEESHSSFSKLVQNLLGSNREIRTSSEKRHRFIPGETGLRITTQSSETKYDANGNPGKTLDEPPTTVNMNNYRVARDFFPLLQTFQMNFRFLLEGLLQDVSQGKKYDHVLTPEHRRLIFDHCIQKIRAQYAAGIPFSEFKMADIDGKVSTNYFQMFPTVTYETRQFISSDRQLVAKRSELSVPIEEAPLGSEIPSAHEPIGFTRDYEALQALQQQTEAKIEAYLANIQRNPNFELELIRQARKLETQLLTQPEVAVSGLSMTLTFDLESGDCHYTEISRGSDNSFDRPENTRQLDRNPIVTERVVDSANVGPRELVLMFSLANMN